MPDRDYFGQCLLPREKATALAEPFSRFDSDGKFDPNKQPKNDPFHGKIEPSLLSAADIQQYVLKTGLIAPFYVGKGPKSLLKDASYEGRIGTKALIFDPGEVEPKNLLELNPEVLTLPPNSIVFVECDLDFRIPEFIALRFNLQIKHVHRGLLLGTGPLIDPGYWGKLCIPLHNLTDEPYEIPINDGLIWIEFTRTTANHSSGSKRIGRPPLGEPFWEIENFLDKAARHYDGAKAKVGIRSSIPAALEDMKNAADTAAKDAKTARRWTQIIGISGFIGGVAAIVALTIGLYSLAHGYRTTAEGRLEKLSGQVQELEAKISGHLQNVEGDFASSSEGRAIISHIKEEVQRVGTSIQALEETASAKNAVLEKKLREIGTIQQQLLDRFEQLEAPNEAQ